MKVLSVLEESPLFAGVERSTLKAIRGSIVTENWPKHSALLTPETTAQRFMVISRGRVKVTCSNRSGRELTLWLLGPGDAFDVVSLPDGQPHGITAWTMSKR